MEELGWQILESNRREASAALIYKVVHGLVVVSRECHTERHQGRTRFHNSLRLKLYAPKAMLFITFFLSNTIKNWNNLNEETVTAPTVDTFKVQINHIKCE